MFLRSVVGCVLAASLVGCSGFRNKPLPSSDQLREQGVSVSGVEVKITEVTRGKEVGAQVVRGLAAVLVGGVALSTRNKSLTEDQYVSLENYRGSLQGNELDQFESPVPALSLSLERRLAEVGITTTSSPSYRLNSQAFSWAIDYEKLTDGSSYRLYFNINTNLVERGKTLATYSCIGATREKRDFDGWKNDPAAIRRNAALIGDRCAANIMSELGLEVTDGQSAVRVEERKSP
ncbi:hypothetical protein [Pinirhizobacter soli]|uniref:hypothetical protein n=1 Tax=Pinirhizobacter soli TaxID=2786953 RepID=UPI00202A2739|nr:hypothetical protein [Pinirhizobacter soli]